MVRRCCKECVAWNLDLIKCAFQRDFTPDMTGFAITNLSKVRLALNARNVVETTTDPALCCQGVGFCRQEERLC